MTRDAMGFVTHIRKVRAHAGVQGNELADAAPKSVITNKDPGHQSKVVSHTLGAIPQRPEFWLMYKVTPAPDPAVMCTGLESASLRPSWESLQPNALGRSQAFTRPSQQFRKQTRRAVLASLRQTSVYRRLMLDASERGARLAETGKRIQAYRHPQGNTKRPRTTSSFSGGNSTTANWQRGMAIIRQMLAVYVECLTPAPTSGANAIAAPDFSSRGTMRPCNWCMP